VDVEGEGHMTKFDHTTVLFWAFPITTLIIVQQWKHECNCFSGRFESGLWGGDGGLG
jgi:hypothetical protein